MSGGADVRLPTGAADSALHPLPPAFHAEDLLQAVQRIREPALVVRDVTTGRMGVGFGGSTQAPYTVTATLPALYPEWLGDRSFCDAHGVRFPYVVGEMANGIATADMVIATGRGGMLGFFGAAGLDPARIERALDAIESALGPLGATWGSNLIHNLYDPAAENAVVELYLRRGVRRVSASAFMSLTPAVVRYACSGLRVDPSGRIQRRNHLFAKVSRPEVARLFLSPAPPALLAPLVASGALSADEAALAARVPLAEDITVEADSGGHTDNRPLSALFPTLAELARSIGARHGYRRPVRVGAAGGLGTPSAVAAAFALGASYVLTGSINQAAVESGLSDAGKQMLAGAALSDVTMAPAADMFELGVEVQVLSRATLFSVRGHRLRDVYRSHESLEAIPSALREKLEREIFRASLDEVWAQTRAYFEARDPGQVSRALVDGKHRMALVFRWYLGRSSEWAIRGAPERKPDFQIWCGPAMGAFNAWAAGSFLEPLPARGVVQIARNLLEGAAVATRAQLFRSCGVPVPAAAFDYRPRPLA
jgi:PfaD family protein